MTLKEFNKVETGLKSLGDVDAIEASKKIGSKYEYASLLIVCKDFNFEKNDLLSIILHEIQHIYDSFDYESYSKMNADIIFNRYLDDDISDIDKKDVDDLLSSVTYEKCDIAEKVKKLSIDSIRYFFNNYVTYICNVSEMNARMVNFKKDIDMVDKTIR